MINEQTIIDTVFNKISHCHLEGLKAKSIIMNNKHALELGGHLCGIMKDGEIIQFIGLPVIISDYVDEIQIGV